jgi:hypothetical protein
MIGMYERSLGARENPVKDSSVALGGAAVLAVAGAVVFLIVQSKTAQQTAALQAAQSQGVPIP